MVVRFLQSWLLLTGLLIGSGSSVVLADSKMAEEGCVVVGRDLPEGACAHRMHALEAQLQIEAQPGEKATCTVLAFGPTGADSDCRLGVSLDVARELVPGLVEEGDRFNAKYFLVPLPPAAARDEATDSMESPRPGHTD